MIKRGYYLFAAVAATVCAVIWLANCVLDVTMKIGATGQIALHGLCTVIWAVCAALWWVRWHRE